MKNFITITIGIIILLFLSSCEMYDYTGSGSNVGTEAQPCEAVAQTNSSEAGTFMNPQSSTPELMYSAVFCTKYGMITAYMTHAQASDLDADAGMPGKNAGAYIKPYYLYSGPTTGINTWIMVGDAEKTTFSCGTYKTEEILLDADTLKLSVEEMDQLLNVIGQQ